MVQEIQLEVFELEQMLADRTFVSRASVEVWDLGRGRF